MTTTILPLRRPSHSLSSRPPPAYSSHRTRHRRSLPFHHHRPPCRHNLRLRSRPRKGWPPRPQPRPPRPPPRRGRETTIFLEGHEQCIWWRNEVSPLLSSLTLSKEVTRRNTTKAHQKDSLQRQYKKISDLGRDYDQKGRKSLPSVGNFNCLVICSVCRHIKFTNTHVENGHFLTCVGASVYRNHLFWPRTHIRR